MDVPLKEYRYKRRFGWAEILLACIWIIFAIYIAYRMLTDSEHDWTRYILAILYGSLCIINSIKAILQYYFSEIRIDSQGIYYHFSLCSYFSWNMTWNDLNQAYFNKKWYQNVLSLLPAKESAIQGNKLIEIKLWRQIDNSGTREAPIQQAIKQFADLKDSVGMQSIDRPLGQDLGKAAEKAAMVIISIILVCIAAGFYVHRFVTLNEGIPLWTMVLGGVIGALLTVFYLLKGNAQFIAIPILSLFAAVVGAFLFAILIKSCVILWGTDHTLDFELIKKAGGHQEWRAINDRNLFFELGYEEAKIRTNAKQGHVIRLETRSGILSITLLLPGEIDKTKMGNL